MEANQPAIPREHIRSGPAAPASGDVPLGDGGLDILAGHEGLRTLYLDGAGISDAAWERYFARRGDVHVHVDQAHHDRDPNRHE